MSRRCAGGRALASLAIAVMLAACNAGPGPTPVTPTPPSTSTPTSTPTPPPTPGPTSTPDLALARQTATLYEQDFESGTALGIFDQYGNWSVSTDSSGNHVFCNAVSQDWQSFKFGSDTWTDYAVEARVEFLAETPDEAAEIYTRVDSSMAGYRGTLYQASAGLTYYPPTTSLGGSSFPTGANTWYTLRVEAAGSHLKFFVDDRPIADGLDSQRSIGTAGFGVGPNTRACVDAIRLWALTPDGQIVSTSPRAKYEGDCVWCFVDGEGPLAPIGDPATGFLNSRAGDTRPVVTLDGGYQVPAGGNVTFDNKIIIVKPVQRKPIEVFGTLTITNSLMLWQQTDYNQTWLEIQKGGTLVVKDSYAFSGNQYWVGWEYEDGSTVKFDHFIGEPVQTIWGSVDYSAINYSDVKLTLLSMTHDTRVQVSSAHQVWFEIFPPPGTYTFRLPAKRQWADWTGSDIWLNTTIQVHDSYIYEQAITLDPNTNVTVQDTPSGVGIGWAIYKDSPGYVSCELKNVGEPGTGPGTPKKDGTYYKEMTWDLPCIDSSLTMRESNLENMWPAVYGSVHVKIYGSNVADANMDGAGATLEIYDSSILQVFDQRGDGRVYIEDSRISDVIDVRGAGAVVYGYGVTGPYQVLKSDGGAYVPLDKPGPPW